MLTREIPEREAQPALRHLLHVGCGPKRLEHLPGYFHDGWGETRLDIDPGVSPDVVASITDLRGVEDGSVDALWSSHNIEHLFHHEVRLAARAMRPVLRDDGWAVVTCPDAKTAMRHALRHGMDSVLYTSPMGPISPRDVLFGHQKSIRNGNAFMAHRTAFDLGSLVKSFEGCGFRKLYGERRGNFLWMIAGQFGTTEAARQRLHAVIGA